MPSIDSAPISEAPWNPSTTDYKDAAAYCDACLIDTNPSGSDKQVGLCKLPIFTPAGALSRRAVAAASARFNQVQGDKGDAAGKLVAAHRRLKMDVPAVLSGAAGTKSAAAMNNFIRKSAGK